MPVTRDVYLHAASRRSGFYLPDEAGLHLRTFMQWPVNRKVYRDPVFLAMVQQSIADIANKIVQFEPVVMLMTAQHTKQARKFLSGSIEIWDIATDDLWCRDSGPTFVVNHQGQLAVSQLNFNGWGNKQVHGNDGKIAAQVAERLQLPVIANDVVGEAGGVEADGSGVLIAHESSWVNPNRNAKSRNSIAASLKKALGADKIIWAPGIKGADITDYHIDSLARFIKPGVVLIQLPAKADPEDPWSITAYQTYQILKTAEDNNGNRLQLEVIPEPVNPRITSADFVASYVNYYLCNGAVILARFGDDETDSHAEAALKRFFPARQIVTLNIDPIGEVGGGIHCATQQQPAV